jgi:hypothetical protein
MSSRRRAIELVGTAGTVTTLAALDLDLPAYDAARVHGHRLGARRWSGNWPAWALCPSPTVDGCRASSRAART